MPKKEKEAASSFLLRGPFNSGEGVAPLIWGGPVFRVVGYPLGGVPRHEQRSHPLKLDTLRTHIFVSKYRSARAALQPERTTRNRCLMRLNFRYLQRAITNKCGMSRTSPRRPSFEGIQARTQLRATSMVRTPHRFGNCLTSEIASMVLYWFGNCLTSEIASILCILGTSKFRRYVYW